MSVRASGTQSSVRPEIIVDRLRGPAQSASLESLSWKVTNNTDTAATHAALTPAKNGIHTSVSTRPPCSVDVHRQRMPICSGRHECSHCVELLALLHALQRPPRHPVSHRLIPPLRRDRVRHLAEPFPLVRQPPLTEHARGTLAELQAVWVVRALVVRFIRVENLQVNRDL